jgi:hypothetical protein
MKSGIDRYLKSTNTTELNLSKLSRETNIGLSSLWFYLRSGRKWPADAFFKVLNSLGSLTVDPANNYVIVKFNKSKETSKILKDFLNRDYKNGKPKT